VTTTDVGSPKPSVPRATIAVVFLVAFLAYAVLSVLGVWNPRRYVFLLTYFNNPTGDAVVLLVFGLIAFWCGFPVRNTAIDRRRSLTRTTLIILIAVSLIVLGFTYSFGAWRYRPTVVSTSPDGQRAAAFVSQEHGTEIHIFAGSGLRRRDVGSVGTPCGLVADVSADWVDNNEVKISTAFNNYDVHLDPKTGAPLDHFGATCSS
jgi:hypothetical protein